MMPEFAFEAIQSAEFGVCVDTDEGESYRLVPCVAEVQEALKEMLAATVGSLFTNDTELSEFSPAEKYGANEKLSISIDSNMVAKHREVFNAGNLPTDTHALDKIAQIVSYFAIFRDNQNRKLMAFRRASYFKGILNKCLLRFCDDALRIVPDNVFKLDTDFDFLILDSHIYIWRPSGFVFTLDMDEHVSACAMRNVDRIAEDITCTHFDGFREFISTHKRAMRLVAAIRSRNDLPAISRELLRSGCHGCDIGLLERNGKLMPAPGSELAFLMLLDRRRYTLTLIEEQPETYEAASRQIARKTE